MALETVKLRTKSAATTRQRALTITRLTLAGADQI
jgi:hypothetical protein